MDKGSVALDKGS